jgi:ADP-heptose:LPS heptosyltransferase
VNAPILLYRPGAIGDTLLLWPALAALRRAQPANPLWLIGHPALAELFRTERLVDRYLSRDSAAADALFAPTVEPARQRLGPLAAAVVWTTDPAGLLRRNLEVLGADPVILAPSRPPHGAGRHVAEHLFGTLGQLGVSGALTDWITPRGRFDRAEPFAELPGAGPLVLLHPGSGSARKNWPAERFAALAERLAERHGARLVATFGEADATARAAFVGSSATLLDSPPLLELAGLLRRAALYVGNDSGISHLAGLCGTPALVLFGPTDPVLWRPLGRSVAVLRHEPLADLGLDQVLAAALELLAEESARDPA